MNEDLLKTMRINLLADFYQNLLTPTQIQYINLYYSDDYSLGEIAQLHHVSRQAVYDNLKRTVTTLENYEQRLHLYRNFNQRQQLIDQIQQCIVKKYPNDVHLKALVDQLAQLE